MRIKKVYPIEKPEKGTKQDRRYMRVSGELIIDNKGNIEIVGVGRLFDDEGVWLSAKTIREIIDDANNHLI